MQTSNGNYSYLMRLSDQNCCTLLTQSIWVGLCLRKLMRPTCGPRRILKIPSPFIDRRYSNRVVLQRCTEILFANQGDQRQFEVFSRSYIHRTSKLLGHVLRAGPEDPMRQIFFQRYSAVRPQYGRKRV